jgi:hypothetical protein
LLRDNILTGKIPTEIGLLMSLGECVLVIDRQRACSVTLDILSYQPRDSNALFGLTVGAADLYLQVNALTGMIPTEIGLMTSLGECVHVGLIHCHNVLAQLL